MQAERKHMIFTFRDDTACEEKGKSKVLPRMIEGNGNGYNSAICFGIITYRVL